MSQSLVPNIKMSRGNNRKTKFNVSTNTHTTAEIGYLQPTFSKMLLPKSDLKLKVSDFCRMSSLVVPSFGELSVRHWFNCTPLSSLWSCYGGYMSGSQYPDYDSATGTSVRRFMPMASVNEILNLLGNKDYELNKGSFFGNLIYIRNKANDSGKSSYGVMEFGSFYAAIMGQTGFSNYLKRAKGIWSTLSSTPQEAIKVSELKRQRLFYNAALNGIVVKNDAVLMKHVSKSDGTTSFPSPTECPYVVLRGYSKYYEDEDTYKDCGSKYYIEGNSSNFSDHTGSFEILPFTTRMFQGDTTNSLYVNGWAHDHIAVKNNVDNIYYAHHKTGMSYGWSLQPNDSYFTGELTNNSYDFSGYTMHVSDATEVVDYSYGLTFSKRLQRLRKVFIGLGYQFNPSDTQPQTLWKLMHYYKAWFDMFYPKRDTQYYQTPLARIVQFMSYHGDICKPNSFDAYVDAQNGSKAGYDGAYLNDWCDLLFAVADAKYLLPIDYYSLADPTPQQTEHTKNEDIKDNAVSVSFIGQNPARESDNQLAFGSNTSTYGEGITLGSKNEADGNGSIIHSDGYVDGFTIKLAQKLTQFLVKKRIVGKSISDRMRAIYGAVDPHDKSHESTWCFGTTSSNININAVVSQAETDELHLGDFAGQGYGGSSSRTFSVDGNDADIFIVTIMTAIVPKVSYYQGHSRENMVGISPNEFITPLWDGVGYDDVHASEYIADIVRHDNTLTGPSHSRSMKDINGQIIGLVPRGTWYKVNGHDTLNGDMSLPRTKDSMSPYVLTKDIDRDFGISPIEMRTISANTFNKIFNESNDLDDHFILQMHIDADLYAPLKSISTSYDTFDSDEDGTIEVSHS